MYVLTKILAALLIIAIGGTFAYLLVIKVVPSMLRKN
jgi:hypothetical protein